MKGDIRFDIPKTQAQALMSGAFDFTQQSLDQTPHEVRVQEVVNWTKQGFSKTDAFTLYHWILEDPYLVPAVNDQLGIADVHCNPETGVCNIQTKG